MSIAKNIFLVLFITPFFSNAQIENPKGLLDSLKNKLNKVNDYSAKVKINLNVTFIKIPVREAVVFYKKPDKIKMKAKGFAMLPKQGVNFSLVDLLNKPYTAVWIKQEKVNNKVCEVIKIIPLDDQPEIIVATAYIERASKLLYKIDANTAKNGSFKLDFNYPALPNPFDLPEKLNFTFEVNKMSLPMGITGDFDNDKPKEKDNKPQKATLSLTYTDYKVNKGIPDEVFADEKK